MSFENTFYIIGGSLEGEDENVKGKENKQVAPYHRIHTSFNMPQLIGPNKEKVLAKASTFEDQKQMLKLIEMFNPQSKFIASKFHLERFTFEFLDSLQKI